jgi:hypothetical protein
MAGFFEGQDPETCDVGDFYGDDAQMLWCSIDCYVRLLRELGITQDFITAEKPDALAQAHLKEDFPRLVEGMRTSLAEVLVEKGFLGHDFEAFFEPTSLTCTFQKHAVPAHSNASRFVATDE